MKKDYQNRKKITVAALAAVALCLAGGLFYYVGTLSRSQQPDEGEQPTENVWQEQEIEPEAITATSSPIEVTVPEKPLEEETAESGSDGTVPETDSGEKEAPADVKLKSPAEAVPPDEPDDIPEVPVQNPDETGECQPEEISQPEEGQPQGGEKQDGKIYVPGFGWVVDEGGGSIVHEAPNAGTGEIIGEM